MPRVTETLRGFLLQLTATIIPVNSDAYFPYRVTVSRICLSVDLGLSRLHCLMTVPSIELLRIADRVPYNARSDSCCIAPQL